MTVEYGNFGFSEESLHPLRLDLYHSSGPGYYVCNEFKNSTFVDHLRKVWSEVEPYYLHEKFHGWNNITLETPNLEAYNPGVNRIFTNFFWNPPLDDVTHAIALYITILRNRVEGKPPTQEIFPNVGGAKSNRAVSYRVISTYNQAVVAPPHRDWIEPASYDLARLQATLILSQYGVDYSGDGFIFTTNQGERVIFGKDVPVKPGDLILWRYNNQHAILNVRSNADQKGFTRIIFPPEQLQPPVTSAAPQPDARYSGEPGNRPKRSIWNKQQKAPSPGPSVGNDGRGSYIGVDFGTNSSVKTFDNVVHKAISPTVGDENSANSVVVGNEPLIYRLKLALSDTVLGRYLLVPLFRLLKGRN